MSNRKPRFAPEASVDIRRIVRHSRRSWGDRRAQVYRGKLNDACARIAEYPGIGGAVHGTGRDIRRLTVEQHHIYYLIDEVGVLVLRVVHVRMDDPDLDL